MTFVITRGCCNDASCISVCPVQCIRPRPGDPDFVSAEQLYIDPDTCIDCGACMDECPVDAAVPDYDLDPDDVAIAANAEYFAAHPIEAEDLPAVVRRTLPAGVDGLRVAIVGSGPAACYAAGLLGEIPGVAVSVFERLPTPYGLVRAGVAPDHEQTRSITERFRAYLSRPTVDVFLNVEVGAHVSLDELRSTHDAVIWAGGAAASRELGLPGEDLAGVMSATDLVAWYNGAPSGADRQVRLDGGDVVVIGNGNVALDVARVLTAPVDALRRTDIADHALAALADSKVERVQVVARRWAEASAFSAGELMALQATPGIDVLADPTELDAGAAGADAARTPALRRKVDAVAAAAALAPHPEHRSVTLRYLLRPVALEGIDRVTGVVLERQRVVAGEHGPTLEPTGEQVTVPADLVVYAVGYRGREVPGLPFDEATGTLPNAEGRVLDADGTPVPGVYCAGWVKRGPSGVIGSNKACATETVEALLADLAAGRLPAPSASYDELAQAVGQRTERLDLAAWNRINAAERQAGRAQGRPRVKLVTVEELLAASRA